MIFATVVSVCSGIMTIIGLLTLFIKPIREKILKTKSNDNITLEIALNLMTSLYFDVKAKGEIKQWQYESFVGLYKSYRAMGGNHFAERMMGDIDKIPIVEN